MKVVFASRFIFCLFLCISFRVTGQTPPESGSNSEDAGSLSLESVRLYNAGKYREAVPLAMRVVEICEKERGPGHFQTGLALRNLGLIQRAAGDKKSAQRNTERAISIYSATPALTDSQVSQKGGMYQMLGMFEYEQQKFEKAAELFELSVREHEKVKSPNELELADAIWSLANLYYIRWDFKKSEPLFKRVLELRAKKLDRYDFIIHDAKIRYDCTAFKNSNVAEAKTFIESLFPVDDSGKEKSDSERNLPRIIEGGVINGRALSLPKPQYPVEARRNGAYGPVSVKITINEDGKVIFACASAGNRLLWDASENAAYGARFSPTSLSGKPVKVAGVITYNYVR